MQGGLRRLAGRGSGPIEQFARKTHRKPTANSYGSGRRVGGSIDWRAEHIIARQEIANLERLNQFVRLFHLFHKKEKVMISKFVLPMLLISCLAGCATQDSYSKALGLPDTTSSQKE